MTEAEWLACSDPIQMLWFVRGKASERKLRLFAYACHSTNRSIRDSTTQEMLELLEQLADDPRATTSAFLEAELEVTIAPASRVWEEGGGFQANWNSEEAESAAAILSSSCAVGEIDLAGAAEIEAERARGKAGQMGPEVLAAWTNRQKLHSFYVRDLFGSLPFHPVAVPLGESGDTVRSLAETIYADRAFDRLPILADALEEAGCTEAAVLEHCRGPGPHARGCWVVDLLLGKS